MTLWTDNKNEDDLIKEFEDDSHHAAYNVHEDVKCLHERIAELEAALRDCRESAGNLFINGVSFAEVSGIRYVVDKTLGGNTPTQAKP